MPEIYTALAYQMPCTAINQASDTAVARQIMGNTLDTLGNRLRASKSFLGADLKLVLLPEYFLTGFPQNESIKEWKNKAALQPDGPEYTALKRIAETLDIFLSGNVYEQDPHFPDLFFQTSFIIAPDAQIILRYRRLYSLFSPSPLDVWERYREIYSADDIFPVVDTAIGRLSALASEEILFPEIPRILAAKGAEIILHPTSEAARAQHSPKAICAQARAVENMAYVITANSAGIHGTHLPPQSTDGHSKIIDFEGHILCEAAMGDSMSAYGNINISALRHNRRTQGMHNFLSRQQTGELAPFFENAPRKGNRLLNRGSFLDQQREAIETLIKDKRL